MSSFSETSLSLLASNPPASTTTKVIFIVLVLTMASVMIHLASPVRLMRVLVAAINQTEEMYLKAIEAGALSKTDVHIAEMLSRLQIKVSNIREATLRDSLSTRRTLREFFKGRTFAVLNCMREVRELEAHIEILKEEHIRAPDPLGPAMRMASLRRQNIHTSFRSKF
ncbi:hypothetical protein C8R44DRAFT_879311 [Mycena epipterygia]|nr:hypothetical protein C8R44DRAFT_879311 [Mycena epipterygia]